MYLTQSNCKFNCKLLAYKKIHQCAPGLCPTRRPTPLVHYHQNLMMKQCKQLFISASVHGENSEAEHALEARDQQA